MTCAAVAATEITQRFKNARFLPAAFLAAAAVPPLLHNARSIFGMALLSAIFVLVAAWLAPRPGVNRSLTPRTFGLVILGGILCGQGLISAYGAIAENGFLGDEARIKYESQSTGDINIIQGGRVESLVSTAAIADSPIIGHGSWAKDIYYVRMLRHRLVELGVSKTDVRSHEASDLIPTHSHLLGAWVEAGIAGAIFWMWVLILCMVVLYRLLKYPHPLTPIAVTSAFAMIWDIPFSPFGADQRFIRAVQMALVLYVIVMAKAQQPDPARLNTSRMLRPRAGPIAAAE